MKNKHIKWYIIAGCVALFLALTSYHAGPWRGQVIDAETKMPIEGAAVVVVWQWGYSSPAGDINDFLDARETLTDKDGRFDIPSAFFVRLPLVRGVYGPDITIFKPGYGSFTHYRYSQVDDDPFEGNDEVVELPVLRTRDERLKALGSADILVPYERIPKLFNLINVERSSLGLGPVGKKEGTNYE